MKPGRALFRGGPLDGTFWEVPDLPLVLVADPTAGAEWSPDFVTVSGPASRQVLYRLTVEGPGWAEYQAD